MKKTFKELRELNGAYMALIKENPKVEKTKFGWAWKRFFTKNLEKAFEEYNTCVSNARMDNALTDKNTGEVMLDMMSPRGFKFNKEGIKAVFAEEKRLQEEWDSKEYEIEPYFCSDDAKYITSFDRDTFEGIIIKPSAEV